MKGNQINTWNGRWISQRYDREYDSDDPLMNFNPLVPMSDGLFNLQTVPWAEVIAGIARNNRTSNMVGYLYSIGQTNTTVGFIPFKLQDIIRPSQLYAKIFGESVWMQNRKKVEAL